MLPSHPVTGWLVLCHEAESRALAGLGVKADGRCLRHVCLSIEYPVTQVMFNGRAIACVSGGEACLLF